MRLFIAILLDEPVKDALCQVRDRLRAAAESGRMTRRENLHLTLAFLGEVPPSRIQAIRRCMEAAAGPAFDLELRGVGRFRRDGGDIWWMGAALPPALLDLSRGLNAGLRDAGFPLEDRELRPHLTLGREIRLPRAFDRAALEAPALLQPVRRIHLMQSDRVKGVLTYTPLLAVPLQ
jgi:2'-5' RNA ligase